MKKPKNQSAPKPIARCKYAGDPNDEYCKDCNGFEIEVDGRVLEATDCGGYEAESAERITQLTQEQVDDVPFDVGPPAQVQEKPVNEKPAQTTQTAESGVESQDQGKYIPKGVTTVIRAESGVSIEMQNKNSSSTWYKFVYAEERTIPADANLELEKEALWNDVNRTVDDQVAITLESLK